MSTITHSAEIRKQIQHASIQWCEVLVRRWLPGGRIDGNEYTVLNPTRDDKTAGSFRINVASGAWADFAVDGMRGQSPVSLYQHLYRVSREEAIEEIGRQLGMIDGSGIKPDFSGLLASVKGGAGQDAAATDENECVMPVPEEAGDAPIQRGETGRWPYLNRDGKLLGYVLRFDPPGKRKWYSPLTFWKNGGWKMKHWPSPKPLYGLDLLAARPDDPVLVVEGEKTCDAARRHFGERYVCMTWPGGAEAADRAFWEPLRDRDVLLLSDNDQGGFKGMRKAGECLMRALARSITMIDALPDGTPVKWDVADAETLDLEWLDGLARSAIKEEWKGPTPVRRREEPEIRELSVQSWEPIPVSALAELERQISFRVDADHPIARQQTALAVAAHACGHWYATESGESCGLYLGIVGPSDIQHGYKNAAFALLQQAGMANEFSQERLTSNVQVYGMIALYPNLFYALLNFGDTVKGAKRQNHQNLSNALSAIVDLYDGKPLTIEDGKKKKTVAHPSATMLAFIAEQQVPDVFCETESARGTLGRFQVAWADDDERIKVGAYDRNTRAPYPAEVVEAFKSLRPTSLLESIKGGELEPSSKILVRFHPDTAIEMAALQRAVFDLFDHERGRMAVRNAMKTAAVLAVWRDKAEPFADLDIVQWCCRRERSRARVEADRVGKNPGGGANAYDRAVAFLVKKAKEEGGGMTKRDFFRRCNDVRHMKREDQEELYERMLYLGDAVEVDGKNKRSKLLIPIVFRKENTDL